MINAIRIHEHGGPDVLRCERVNVRAPGPGEILMRQQAIGLNFIDIYQRTGLYTLPELPAVLGMEGAGEVIAIGPGVTGIGPGDRVAYAGQLGGYAEERLVPADRVVKLPDGISDVTAAAMMLKGMTARYLLRETYDVGPRTVLLFHAAAGGVGLIACQWAHHLGATVIGTVGSGAKASLALAHGCTHVINTRTEDFVSRVRDITQGQGCDVAYDSIGRDTFPASLECLKPRGLWVSFGNASGAIPSFDIGLLAAKGSLYATRPAIMSYIAAREALVANTNDLFHVVLSGAVKINIDQRYALTDVASAHRDLEARRTVGSSVLLPGG